MALDEPEDRVVEIDEEDEWQLYASAGYAAIEPSFEEEEAESKGRSGEPAAEP